MLAPGRGSLAALLAALLTTLIVLDRLRDGQPPGKRLSALLLAVIILLGAVTAQGVALDDAGYWVRAPSVIVSDVSMGSYEQARQLPNIRSFVGAHVQRAGDPRVPDRVRTHPPGPVLFCYAVRSFFLTHASWTLTFERVLSDNFGVPAGPAIHRAASRFSPTALSPLDAMIALMVALILSTIWVIIALPVFGIGAAVFDRRVGLILAVLAATVPSLLHFAPGIDGLGAVLAATFLCLWLLALKTTHWWAYVLAGVAAAVMLMWSFGFLILGVVAVAAGIAACCQPARPHWCGPALAIATLALAYGLLYLWSGYNILTALPASLAAHRQILAGGGRGYWVWLPMNLYDFLLFTGPALVVVAAATIPGGLVGPQWPVLAKGLVGGLLITVAVLLISGATRGEVGRIWVFLMPLMAVPAARQLAQLREGRLLWAGAGLTALQVGFAIVLSSKLASVMPY